jgi:hypothetical protein
VVLFPGHQFGERGVGVRRSDFVWVTPRRSERRLRRGYYLNTQARTLLAALRSVG